MTNQNRRALTTVAAAVLLRIGISVTPSAQLPAGSRCMATGTGVCRYLDPTGVEPRPGTGGRSFRTLEEAAASVNPGDVVIARDGVYTGGPIILEIRRSGTAANPIVFKAENPGGAVLDGRNNGSEIGIEISGSYIRVEGFEVRGTRHYGIEAYGGGNVTVARNHVHDVGHYCTSTSNGIVGINAYVPNLLIEQNVVHDIGRWADGENGCSTSNHYWQNHDHGIYHGQGDNVTIRNNVFYNFTRGWAIQRYDGAGTVVSNLQIVNNTFAGANPNKDGQIIIATGVRGLVIANNIFYQPRTAGIWFDTGFVTGVVANNLTDRASLSTGATTGLSFSGNLLNRDPRFRDAARADFHLLSGSPAIGTGGRLGSQPGDLVRSPRASSPPDIGAFPYTR